MVSKQKLQYKKLNRQRTFFSWVTVRMKEVRFKSELNRTETKSRRALKDSSERKLIQVGNYGQAPHLACPSSGEGLWSGRASNSGTYNADFPDVVMPQ